MARRSIKITPKDAGSENSTNLEKYDDVLNSLESIQTKRKVAASTNGVAGPAVKPTTLIMAIVVVGIAATLLLTFGADPSTFGPTVETSDLDDLDFEIQLLDSTRLMLSDYAGQPIILDLFATWCQPCITQIAELQKLQAKHPNVHILSVSIESDDTIPVLQLFSSQHGMDWVVGRDVTEKGTSLFQVTSIPTMAFFNSQGILKHHDSGIQTEETMSNWIKEN